MHTKHVTSCGDSFLYAMQLHPSDAVESYIDTGNVLGSVHTVPSQKVPGELQTPKRLSPLLQAASLAPLTAAPLSCFMLSQQECLLKQEEPVILLRAQEK